MWYFLPKAQKSGSSMETSPRCELQQPWLNTPLALPRSRIVPGPSRERSLMCSQLPEIQESPVKFTQAELNSLQAGSCIPRWSSWAAGSTSH